MNISAEEVKLVFNLFGHKADWMENLIKGTPELFRGEWQGTVRKPIGNGRCDGQIRLQRRRLCE